MSNTCEFERSLEKIFFSEKDLEDLEQELETVYEEGGLETISHVYGMNQRVNQFEELFQAYREFYRVETGSFREGSRIRENKLNNLMESYRTYFGSGSNEQWNQGVDSAKTISSLIEIDGPLTRDDFYDIISGEYEE